MFSVWSVAQGDPLNRFLRACVFPNSVWVSSPCTTVCKCLYAEMVIMGLTFLFSYLSQRCNLAFFPTFENSYYIYFVLFYSCIQRRGDSVQYSYFIITSNRKGFKSFNISLICRKGWSQRLLGG